MATILLNQDETPVDMPPTKRQSRLAIEKEPALLTAEEAAKHLRLHVKSLYRLAKAAKIPARKVGGQWRFHRDLLNEWLKNT